METLTVQDLALLGIDSPSIFYAYLWGFGTVISSWFIGFLIYIALKTIKLI